MNEILNALLALVVIVGVTFAIYKIATTKKKVKKDD